MSKDTETRATRQRKSLPHGATRPQAPGAGGEEAALRFGPHSSKASQISTVFIYGSYTQEIAHPEGPIRSAGFPTW